MKLYLLVWNIVFLIVENIFSTQARYIDNTVGTELWEPETGSREKFFRCRGLPCDEYSRVLEKLYRIEEQLKLEEGISSDLGDPVDGCIVYTEQQVDALLHKSRHEHRSRVTERTRYKRKLHNVHQEPHKLWPHQIVYVFDGTHDDDEKTSIRKALHIWATSTCITFVEVSAEDATNLTEEHVLFTKATYGCYSFVGKTGKKAQIINLSSPCLYKPGTAIHEIGHTLGLWHEHQRNDREEWITINYDNIGYYVSQFYAQDTLNYGIPYDFTSVMQYPPYAGTRNGNATISAKDPLYQKSMGQRIELSYLDRQMINFAYCNATCNGHPELHCENGGYQDPRRCERCICPDGFSGQLCTEVAPAVNATCGGKIFLNKSEEVYVMSPGYEHPGFYDNYIECAWHIETTPGQNITLKFVEEFGIHQYNAQVCTHWIEVKYGTNMEFPGPRFCGQELPETELTSFGTRLVLIFKAKDEVSSTRIRKGFKMLLSTPAPGESNVTDITNKTWSDWSRCSRDCGCGGCSERTRYKLCGANRCTGNLAETQKEVCDRICTRNDIRPIHPGTTNMFPCPRCCGKYKAKRGDSVCYLEGDLTEDATEE